METPTNTELLAYIEQLQHAAKALADQMDLVHQSPKYIAVWNRNQLHNGQYTGPQYEKQLNDLKQVLSVTPQQSLVQHDAVIVNEQMNRWVDLIRSLDPDNLCDFFDDLGADEALMVWAEDLLRDRERLEKLCGILGADVTICNQCPLDHIIWQEKPMNADESKAEAMQAWRRAIDAMAEEG